MPVKEEFINSKHILYYKHHCGDTRIACIICIHGILSEASLFDNLSILSNYGIDICSITLPGYGASKDDLASINFDDVLYSLHDIIKNIDIPKIILGFSLGTIYAVYYVSKYKYVDKLILASPLFHPIDSKLPEYAIRLYTLYKDGVKEINLLEYLEIPRARYECIKNNNLCRKVYPTSYIADLFLKATNKNILNDIELPILILYGINDRFTANEQVIEFYRLLKSNDKELCMFNTDHWLFDTFSYDKPTNTQIIEHIKNFIVK